MNLSFFSSLFKPKQIELQTSESLLIKKIENITNQYNIYSFNNKTIFHHNHKKSIPLIFLHPKQGLFLFEFKEWKYEDLKNASISKSTNETPSQNNLAFESIQEYILLKYKELTHTDKLEFSNFLIMENLTSFDYDLLSDEFKEYLPSHRIIFSDSSDEEIIKKLSLTNSMEENYNQDKVFSNIFIQYAFFDIDKKLSFASKEQRDFIDAPLKGEKTLAAKAGSGKTNVILLKTLQEKLENPKKQITIIEPTRVAADILRKKLLELIEHAIVDISPLAIEITTPYELIAKGSTNEPLVQNELFIDKKLFSKTIKIADLVICDDADLLQKDFIEYIRLMQKRETLLFVSNNFDFTPDFSLSQTLINKSKKVIFKQANKYAKTMQTIKELLTNNLAKDILVVCDSLTKKNLEEDLKSFIEDKAILLDSSQSLLNQDFDSLLLANYNEISGLEAKFVLLLDIEKASLNQVEYAQHIATDTLYIIYEENYEIIENLKELYESETNKS